MLNSLFGKFSKSSPTAQASSSDQEEDGFLLVGQTASDRTAVHANQFDGKVNCPPHYNKVMENQAGNLPSYQDYMANLEDMKTCNCTTEQQNSAYLSSTMARYLSPLSGVQFQLAHQLQSSLSSDFPWEFFQQLRTFDMSKYDYDFSFERSILRDLSVAEDASGPVTSEDLIQF